MTNIDKIFCYVIALTYAIGMIIISIILIRDTIRAKRFLNEIQKREIFPPDEKGENQ